MICKTTNQNNTHKYVSLKHAGMPLYFYINFCILDSLLSWNNILWQSYECVTQQWFIKLLKLVSIFCSIMYLMLSRYSSQFHISTVIFSYPIKAFLSVNTIFRGCQKKTLNLFNSITILNRWLLYLLDSLNWLFGTFHIILLIKWVFSAKL